jgi:hypothetical protein
MKLDLKTNSNLLAGRKEHNSIGRVGSACKDFQNGKRQGSANLKTTGSQSALLTDKKGSSKVVAANLGTNTAKGTPTNFGISLFSTRNNVVIHVCDEAKKKTQDFKCDRSLLL